MEAVIRKWGNSPAVRLPALVLKEAALSLEQKVTVIVTRGRIVIEPSENVEYKLDDLLAGITPQNAHRKVSFGKQQRQDGADGKPFHEHQNQGASL